MRLSLILAAAAIAGRTGDDLNRQTPAEPVHWRAQPVLDENDSGNCGVVHRESFEIEIDGNIIRTRAWTGRSWK